MVQFLPRKASLAYDKSQGFPSVSLLRLCLGTDTVQATVSVLCQIIFLASKANRGAQAQALSGMNITFAVLGSLSGLLVLHQKYGLLDRPGVRDSSNEDKSEADDNHVCDNEGLS